jgi:hypothetical protein
VAEGGSLLNCCTLSSCTEGSNSLVWLISPKVAHTTNFVVLSRFCTKRNQTRPVLLSIFTDTALDDMPSSSGNWNNHDVLNGLTASANRNIAYPISWQRLNGTNYISGST